MPTLTPLAPPQLIGIYGSPMERLGIKRQIRLGKKNRHSWRDDGTWWTATTENCEVYPIIHW